MQNLTHYDKFIGQKVNVDTSYSEFQGMKYPVNKIQENDEVISSIESRAAKDHLIVRTRLPRTMCTADFRTDRINIYIDKNSDDEFVITKISLG